MHFTKPLVLFLFNAAVAKSQASGCGIYDGCIGTETCITRTVTTCIPAPTCLTVYASCEFGGTTCCSGYCAATKCRPTDEEWPKCKEDFDLCWHDDECCYKNKCVEGLCRRPE